MNDEMAGRPDTTGRFSVSVTKIKTFRRCNLSAPDNDDAKLDEPIVSLTIRRFEPSSNVGGIALETISPGAVGRVSSGWTYVARNIGAEAILAGDWLTVVEVLPPPVLADCDGLAENR